MNKEEKTNIHIDANQIINPLFAAIIVNAWYSAQILHFSEKGSLSSDEKVELLQKVVSDIGMIRETIEKSPEILSQLNKKL